LRTLYVSRMLRRLIRRLLTLGVIGGVVWYVTKLLRGDPVPAANNELGTAAWPALAPTEDPVPRPSPEAAPVLDPDIEPSADAAKATTPPPEKAKPSPPKKAIASPTPSAHERPIQVRNADPARRPWIEVAGDAVPDTHPVKAKLKSGIYHLPGMLNYDRTVPDRWYADAEAAEADGLRPAKR